MKSKEIVSLARQFTKGALGLKRNEKITAENTKSMCFAISCALSGYLRFCGVENDVTECTVINGDSESWGHYFITLKDGRVLDCTIMQFEIDGMPDIYLGERPDFYLNTPPVSDS